MDAIPRHTPVSDHEVKVQIPFDEYRWLTRWAPWEHRVQGLLVALVVIGIPASCAWLLSMVH